MSKSLTGRKRFKKYSTIFFEPYLIYEVEYVQDGETY